MVDATEHEIWGDRAKSLTEAMSVMSAPIQMGTLHHFAMRKGWEQKTLEGVLAYCQRQHLVEPYKAFNGKAAFKLTGAAVPEVPVTETDPDADDDHAEVETSAQPAEPGPVETLLESFRVTRCLCADGQVNYGCPLHGGARTTTEENTDMAKDWISTAEAAKLLECHPSNLTLLARSGKIKRDGEGGRGTPSQYSRTSVIAYRDQRQRVADLLPATPAKRKASAPSKSKALVPAAASSAVVVQLRGKAAAAAAAPPTMLDDLRALVRCVDLGWVSADAAWAHIRGLLAPGL